MLAKSAIVTDFPGRWLLYWLLTPNLAMIVMWSVGGPPMTPVIAECAFVAVLAAQLPWVWPKRFILAALIAYSNFYYICALFNLSTGQFDTLLPFLLQIQPFRSPEYIIAAIVLSLSMALALTKAPGVRRFSSPMSYLLAIFATMGFLTVDYIATKDTRSSYSRKPPPSVQFVSATGLTQITQPNRDSRHLVIVMVESFGVPVRQAEKAIFEATWIRPGWSDRYDVSHGEIPFFGATTDGEMRELCGRYASYSEVAEFGTNCLPARYRAAGYETTALHGFSSSFFSREDWYPQIGFARSEFHEDLARRGLSRCEGVFAGVCDRQVPAVIMEQLKTAKSPQLIYFLTLNTHLPIKSNAGLGTNECKVGGADWANEHPQLCRLFFLQGQLADEIDRLAMDIELPPTDILIVGDHFPPFFDRNDRKSFRPGVVPWIFLSHRTEQGIPLLGPKPR